MAEENKRKFKQLYAVLSSPITNLITAIVLNVVFNPLMSYYIGQKLKESNASTVSNINTMNTFHNFYYLYFIQILLFGFLTFTFCRFWVTKKLKSTNDKINSNKNELDQTIKTNKKEIDEKVDTFKKEYESRDNSLRDLVGLEIFSNSTDILLLKSIVNEFYEPNHEKSNRLIKRLFDDTININALKKIGFNSNLLSSYEAYIKLVEIQNIIDKNPELEQKIFGIRKSLNENNQTDEAHQPTKGLA